MTGVNEIGGGLVDPASCLPDDFEAPNRRILNQLILFEAEKIVVCNVLASLGLSNQWR